jgi:hypothetical protein
MRLFQCVGKVSEQAYGDFAFHPFATRFPSSAEEQYPGFRLERAVPFLASHVDVAAPLSSFLGKANAVPIVGLSQPRIVKEWLRSTYPHVLGNRISKRRRFGT